MKLEKPTPPASPANPLSEGNTASHKDISASSSTKSNGGKPRRGPDAELQTMAKLDRLLSELTPESLPRVIAWLVARYVPGCRFSITKEAVPNGNLEP